MPNWCSNNVTVKNLSEENLALIDAAALDGTLLETFVPTEDPENWYDEHCDKWGTKWDVCDAYITITDGVLDMAFDTAWAPPFKGFLEISRQCPEATFTGCYDESGMGFWGEFEFKAGEIITDIYRTMDDEDDPVEEPVDLPEDEPVTLTENSPGYHWAPVAPNSVPF